MNAGLKIVESEFLVEQFRFPRSKKKRIRKKWANRKENWRPNIRRAYQMGDLLICHPIFAQRLRKQLKP